MRKINLKDAVKSTIEYLYKNKIDLSIKKNYIFGYKRSEINDDTGLERNNNFYIDDELFNYFIVRKTINYYIVKVKHYDFGEKSNYRNIAGSYKWCKTIMSFGVDRLINSLVTNMKTVGLIETENHEEFTVYSPNIHTIPYTILCCAVCCTGLFLLVDPIDVHDAIKGKKIDRTYFIQSYQNDNTLIDKFNKPFSI